MLIDLAHSDMRTIEAALALRDDLAGDHLSYWSGYPAGKPAVRPADAPKAHQERVGQNGRRCRGRVSSDPPPENPATKRMLHFRNWYWRGGNQLSCRCDRTGK
jgi:hypothetical protein